MRNLDIEARYDDNHPEGGHAVLACAGLDLPAGPVKFTLNPRDTLIDPDRLEELREPQEAVEIREVDGGIEIVLGPQTTAHPALETGTVVEVTLMDLDVRGDIVWPAVMPLARPRRPGLQIKKTGGKLNGSAHPVGVTAPSRDAPRVAPVIVRGPVTEALGEARHSHVPNSSTTPVPAASPAQVHTAEPRRDSQAFPPPASPPRPYAAPASVALPHSSSDTAPSTTLEEPVVFYPHARGGKLGTAIGERPRSHASLLPSTPISAALVTALVMLAVFGFVEMRATPPKALLAAPSTTSNSSQITAPTRPSIDPMTDLSLFDLLSPGAVSPRGIAAKDVTSQTALEYAHTAINRPDGQRDTEEGAFWLRRYLATIGADERTRRALTQLGSTFADSASKSVNYARARQVWELASAFGDPVAMCFLGVLHENGLTGPIDKKQSLVWFERAKAAGGCPGVDEALARLKT